MLSLQLSVCSHPFLYFPVFYSMKAGVERKPLSYAWDKYQSEIWDSCKVCAAAMFAGLKGQ